MSQNDVPQPTNPARPVSPEMSTPLNTILEPLYAVRGWIKLIGVLSILTGIIQCLTCIGAIIGWLPIWMGVLLNNAATSVEQAHDRQDPVVFIQSQRKLALYIKICGVLVLISLVLMAAGFIFSIFVPAALYRILSDFPRARP